MHATLDHFSKSKSRLLIPLPATRGIHQEAKSTQKGILVNKCLAITLYTVQHVIVYRIIHQFELGTPCLHVLSRLERIECQPFWPAEVYHWHKISSNEEHLGWAHCRDAITAETNKDLSAMLGWECGGTLSLTRKHITR